MSKLLIFIFTLFSFNVYAQNKDFQVVFKNPKTGYPALIRFSESNSSRPSLESPANWFKANLNANNDFNLVFNRMTSDRFGMKHYRYYQSYKGIQIDGAEIILHTKGNKVISISGMYLPEFSADIRYVLSKEKALDMVLQKYEGSTFMWEIASEERQLKLSSGNPNASYKPAPRLILFSTNDSCLNKHYKVAYEMDLYIQSPVRTRPKIYVDANSGEILDTYEQICSIDRVGLAHTKYSGIREIHTDSIGADTFILKDNTRGKGIYTIDARVVSVSDSSRDFIDHDNVWDNVNDFKDEVATDVHWGSATTYDFYKAFFNRDSYDDSGSMIYSRVHVEVNYNNAYWDGYSANYGDGDAVKYKPFTSLDICAHELTHGVTQNSAGLRYRNESGALNESFSDLFAKAVELTYDTSNFDWYIGKDIAIAGVGNALRNMSFPGEFEDPKYYEGENFYIGTLDNGGVHTNSGVQNFWFYLLCEGGYGLREDGKPYFVTAIGFEKAITVAYSNLTNYLLRFSEYIDACYFSLDAAREIYGENSFEYKQIENAWYAVGLIDEVNVNQVDHNTQWSIFPNPGNSSFQLINPSISDTQELEILDYSGKLVLSLNFESGENINVESLSNGLYFVRVGTYVTKWIKQ